MKFTKMHGLGNDYIFLDCLRRMPRDPAMLSRRVSDRHFGIGSDGLICICPSDVADFRMRMFNADGSEGAMCGNGIRCLGKYVFEKGMTEKTKLTVETPSGLKYLELHGRTDTVSAVTVDMGIPTVGDTIEISVKGNRYTGLEVSMGNPHFVVPVPDVDATCPEKVGPLLEHHPNFQNGVNVEFARVLDQNRFEMRVWERGSGETMACGTGACAAAAALVSCGMLERSVTAMLPGGELEITWRGSDDHLLMTGPAVTVFEGEWYGEDQ